MSRRLARIGRKPSTEIVDPLDPTGIAAALHDLLAEPSAQTDEAAESTVDVEAGPVTEVAPGFGMSDASLAALVMELEITEGELLAGPPRRAGEDFVALMRETYPSIADTIIMLATEEPGDHVQEWLEVARALSDAKHHRGTNLKAEARERALCVAIAHALEAQARSSARLAGWSEEQLDERWEPANPERPGEKVWEHYLCRQAELMRATLHGETIGTWLGALGSLWEAAYHLLELLDAKYYEGLGEDRKAARVALRAALVHVEELALW